MMPKWSPDGTGDRKSQDVAKFSYQPGNCQRPCRMVAFRKNISKMKGEHVLFDEIRYFFCITTHPDAS